MLNPYMPSVKAEYEYREAQIARDFQASKAFQKAVVAAVKGGFNQVTSFFDGLNQSRSANSGTPQASY